MKISHPSTVNLDRNNMNIVDFSLSFKSTTKRKCFFFVFSIIAHIFAFLYIQYMLNTSSQRRECYFGILATNFISIDHEVAASYCGSDRRLHHYIFVLTSHVHTKHCEHGEKFIRKKTLRSLEIYQTTLLKYFYILFSYPSFKAHPSCLQVFFFLLRKFFPINFIR